MVGFIIHRGAGRAFAAIVGGLVLAASGPAAADDGPVIDDVLAILKDRGIVTEEQYVELQTRNSAYEEKHEGLLGRIRFSGDMRARFEGFWFDRDTLDMDTNNRYRGRYRLRLNGEAEINDWVDAHFRIATNDDHRSTNISFGDSADFAPDGLFVHRAYLDLHPREGWLPDSSLNVQVGKTPNPFLWKVGKDYMLWDHDINPEGVGVVFDTDVTEVVNLFANAGYFIIDEESREADPHLLGLQGGVHVAPEGPVSFGGRATWYAVRSIDNAMFNRNVLVGNIEDGLTDATFGGPPRGGPENGGMSGTGVTNVSDDINLIELAGYLAFGGIENWPILLYGHWAQNLDADGSAFFPGAEAEDNAYGVGVEVGDKKKFVQLGAGYWVIQANAWVAQFVDSDLFDGFTNRKGYTVYGKRQIFPNTDLGLTLFVSDEVESTLPAFAFSAADAERVRLQADLEVKF